MSKKWRLNRSLFGIRNDNDLASISNYGLVYFRSLTGILSVTPGVNSFHHSLHDRV